MTTSTPPDNTVLVLRPPMINGQTKLVVGAHIGVPLVAYDLVTDGEGAVVLVDPPLSGTMDPDDVMELWLEDEVTVLDSKTIEDPNVRTTLRIPKGRLHPDKVNKLYYTVRRGSANRGTSTPSLEILYNRIRPGFKDRLTDPGGHSELKLLLPDVIKDGVGPDFVSAEVCVAYPYCRAYDLITLKCNGELLDPKPKVNPNQAPQPPNPGDEPPITICFTITRAYLDKAKRLDKKLHFSYTVTDQIGNGPDTDAPWSPVHSVDEDLDGTRLPMPILLERKEDFPGDDASIIDLEKLAGNPLLVVVLTTDNRFVVGYDVIATYTATNTGQPADVVVTVPGKVEADPFGVKQTLFLEVPNDKVFAGSDVTVTYELRKPNGDLAGNSQVAHARVTGVRLDLKPPSIKEAPNGTSLDPFAGKDTLTAVVDYVGMLLDDEIIVTFSGAPGTPEGGSHITAPWTVRTLGAQDIPLDNTVIAFNLGQSVTVSYTVARGSDDPKDSKTRTLAVLPIKNEDNRLPDPVINGITSAELDVTTLPGQPRTRIAAWLLLALKQTLWLRYFVEGNPTPISTTYNGAVIPPDGVPGGMQPYTPMTELNKLADGAKLRIEFKVGFDGSTDESKAVVFPSRVYTVKALATPLQPSLKEAAGSNSLNPFAAKDTLTVVVPHYTGMASTDQISVTWTGATGTPDGGSHTSTAVEVGTVGEKEIPIPNTVVAFNLGKTVTVFYTVIRNGSPYKSGEFALNVQTIPAEHPELSKPSIIDANEEDDTLDLTSFDGDTQVLVNAWPLIAVGQKFWVRCEGIDENGATQIEQIHKGVSITTMGPQGGALPRSFLDKLAHDTEIRVYVAVNFDGISSIGTAVGFPQRPYTLKNSKLIIYEDFEATTPQQLSVNVPVKLSSGLTLTLLTQGRFYTRIVLIDKYDLGLKTMKLGADSLTRFSWEGLATKIEFTTVRGSSATIEGIITFFDLEGKIIEVKPYIPGDGKHIFKYSAPIGKHIYFFEITPKINGANVMLIDEISIDK
ncbi:hypothetical protein HUW52_23165 [Pseudomonas sp. 43A]|uniref:hypothetical protein n=1 Tax=unclassified Pseudomonas TaxID=196821 RepID=UPI0015874F0D|nr:MULTISPECIES: hypothetical protein [unclassified Pseudomonas]QKV65671.1 hypothetical protein HUW52_23165 [Pseudomonas sp. 43A]QMW11875.1 hypothetical protein H3303_09540 [Pseudomonas sp. 29A]